MDQRVNMNGKRILLTGASGFLGQGLIKELRNSEILGVFNTHMPQNQAPNLKYLQGDLSTLKESLFKAIIKFEPDVVIHTAALTNVDECEKNPSLAQALNVIMTKNVVQLARETSSHLIHISTDQIFKRQTKYFKETDIPDPINQYGLTKLAAEQEVQKYSESSILRTNFYGLSERGASFLNWLESSIKNGRHCTFYNNVYYTPICLVDLVKVIQLMINRAIFGLFNVTGDERVSKAEFAEKVIEVLRKDYKNYIISEYKTHPGSAPRPLEMSLSNEKLKKELNFQPNSISDALKKIFTKL